MISHKFLISFLISFSALDAAGQLIDNFDDGEFSTNPAWIGDATNFVVANNRLHLSAPAISGSASLAAPCVVGHATSWEFSFEMDFNPSSANYLKVCLMTDNPGSSASQHGYFIKAGDTSDDISLYRQDGLTETRIIDGVDGKLNLPAVMAKVIVKRNESGIWQLMTDIGEQGIWTVEGETRDEVYQSGNYFSVVCTFTATRSDKFWFDNFAVRDIPVVDVTPPQLEVVTATNDQSISLEFSEPVDSATSTLPENYRISTLGSPESVIIGANYVSVRLLLKQSMVSGEKYTVTVLHAMDKSGNVSGALESTFLYYEDIATTWKDILITEIMADPIPAVGLPEAEFVELYNKSDRVINIGGWQLSDDHSVARFSDGFIYPHQYLAVTAVGAVQAMERFGPTLGLAGFPGLNNTGDKLVLRNKAGVAIDSLQYDMNWYREPEKEEGGWSLELIDLLNPCGEEDNWVASEDSSGGTPGKKNSVNANKPDLTPPELLQLRVLSENSVLCLFNERLTAGSMSALHFILTPAISGMEVSFADGSHRAIKIQWDEALAHGKLFILSIEGVMDCNGNSSLVASYSFGIPEQVVKGDVLINEILFNPRSGGVDYVEFYNASAKFLDASEWKIGNLENGLPSNLNNVKDHFLISPHSYFVFTADPVVVGMQYPGRVRENLYRQTLPGLPDEEGSLALLSNLDSVLDGVIYSRYWHSALLQDEQGVSLERISWAVPATLRDNWTSAASQAGYGTPGAPNSQRRMSAFPTECEVVIVPEIFSPAGGGGNFAQIVYRFDKPGYVLSLSVFDPQGHPVKTIATNQIASEQGFFQWNGDRDDGHTARGGYYLIYLEAIHPGGSLKVFRKRVVVHPY